MIGSNVAAAEREVERQRDELFDTLAQIKTNMAPKALAGEVMSGGQWLAPLVRAAQRQPATKLIIMLAAAHAGWRLGKRVI